ncbi:chemotaxis protein CheC [Lederbergia wuyishanensis]|uniref:Chemotaxis protein CheC n=1 Tax=Lederbergia wuyishanensis TaxID=1347903 RepID=A0ABU0CZR9_9BACI|nr:chemotaxis protein CheC [Lederbergia wuyishanensis]MCJ8006287.1 chemotaxis protein CheC [Lederbergia wuyishanensis]MDQ0341656.1 chemotaxis protein CheC [Lederbergia wuyishanensis]
MELKKVITPFHLDVLKEIGNIGAGNAATALSVLVGKNIDMKVPSVRIVSFDEMLEMAGGHNTVVTAVYLRVEGDASGSMFFILPIEQATKYVQILTGDTSFSFKNPPYSEMGLSAMQELGNILSGSYLSSLSDFTGLDLFPSVPSISIDMADAILSYGLIELSHTQDYAIVIDTALDEENPNSNCVKGHFFLLPDPNSFSVIFNTLGVELND